jgi:acyl-CoA thioesterase
MIDPAREPVRYAVEIVGADPFARTLGISIDEVRNSYARVSLAIKDAYCNSEARAHGSVLFTLADQAFAVAANSRGYKAFALEIKINYFQGAPAGTIVVAEATPLDIRKRVSLWNIELKNDKGEKIALAQGLAYHFVPQKD